MGGHAGAQRTLARMSTTFHWPKMRQHVRDYVAQCTIFQEVKPLNTAPPGFLQQLPLPSKIWDSLSMDLITHLRSSGGKTVIFVVVDHLTKYAHFYALGSHINVPALAEVFVCEICRLHGFPSSIVSDRDPLFMSVFWKELFKLQGTTLSTSSAYHPQSDGQTEVVNRCLEDYLRCSQLKIPTLRLNIFLGLSGVTLLHGSPSFTGLLLRPCMRDHLLR